MTRLILVGSSFGGLVAALLASRHPERVAGYVLMAPALHDHWPEAVAEISRIPPLAVVIHGTEDEVVPISAIRAWTRAHQVPLLEVRDGHRLHLATEIMVERVRAFLTETSMTAGR